MVKELSIGYSPCPNDTFIFYALVHGLIPLHEFSLASPFLDDVETLNQWALKAKLDVTKLSFQALGHVLDKYVMLSSGAALGRGCGPLLVTRPDVSLDMERATIAIPGSYTTAAMLLKLYAPMTEKFHVMRFEEIIPAIAEGKVDAGVIIHESRFTYQNLGLKAVEDLGEWWEDLTGLPIPLGCIAAKRSLGEDIITELDHAIHASLIWIRKHPAKCTDYIRTHAQEMEDAVLQNHIDLYVNDFSLHIGEEGKDAVRELLRRGGEAGIFPAIEMSTVFAT